jgi:hypothetical protein
MKRAGATLPRSLAVLGAGFLLLASIAWSADDKDSDVDKRVDAAAKVLTEIMGVPDKAIPDKVMSDAKCIAVVPSMVKIAVGSEAVTARGSRPAGRKMVAGALPRRSLLLAVASACNWAVRPLIW